MVTPGGPPRVLPADMVAAEAIGYKVAMATAAPIVLPPGARAVLRAPDALARVLAAADRDPERRWILRRPRVVRASFLEEVVEAGGSGREQRRWMLRQDDEVRASYVAEVLERAPVPDLEAIWLLRQERAVRESYLAAVLDG